MRSKWTGLIALALVAALGLLAPLSVRAAEAEGEEGADQPKKTLTPEEKAAQTYLERFKKEKAVQDKMQKHQAAQRVKVGKAHFDMQDFEKALEQFEKAIKLDPENEQAKEYLKKTRSMLNLRDRQFGDWAGAYADERAIALEVQKTELANQAAKAKKLYAKGRYDEAIAAFTQVEARAKYLSAFADTADLAEEAATYIQKSIEAKDAAAEAREKKRRKAARERSEKLRERRANLFNERIRARMEQARTLFDQHRYEDARKVCEQILREDPTNGAAQTLLDAAVAAARERDLNKAIKGLEVETERHWQQTRAWSVPQYELVHMPREKFEEVRNQSVAAAFGGEVKEPAPWENRIKEAMGKKISFDFVETPLQDVINFISSLVDVTIVLDQAALRDQEAPSVTLKVTDMRLESALNWVLKLVGLKYTLKDEAIFISTPDQIFDEPERRIYDVSDLTIDIKNFQGRQQALASDGGYSSTGSSGGGSGGDSIGEDFFGDEDEQEEEEVITGDSLVELIKRTIAPGTWAEDELGGGAAGGGGGWDEF